jgi:hypothetical protein
MRRNKTRKLSGGSCGTGFCQLPQTGGMRIGVMNPTWGGKNRRPANTTEALLNLAEASITGGGCGCNAKPPMMKLPANISLGPLTKGLMNGGGCGCGAPSPPSNLLGGGGCGCRAMPPIPTPLGGGYRATKRNLKYLKLWKKGKSIGFTMKSSLKAKGLIPRSNGKKHVSPKYRSK